MLTCCGAEVSGGVRWVSHVTHWVLGCCPANAWVISTGPELWSRISVWACRRSSQSNVLALRLYFTARAEVSHCSLCCCYSKLSREERHKWLITHRKLCLKRCRLIVHLHLLSGWEQIKISWPLEAKAMPSKSVPSSPCRVERSLMKCHRMKENDKNAANGPAY